MEGTQAVALIFERIATTEGLTAESTLKATEAALDLKFQPGSSTKAGLLLFNDLCALAAGEKAPWLAVRAHPHLLPACNTPECCFPCGARSPSPLARMQHSRVLLPLRPPSRCAKVHESQPVRDLWVPSPVSWTDVMVVSRAQVSALPRAFALDMLEFVLANHPIVFHKLPNFERLLGGRLASLLLTSLRAERNVEDEAGEMVERRLLMRTVVTVVRNFAQVRP
jgi:hypothetical protein